MKDDRYLAELEASVCAWALHEHPDDPDLATRTGRVAVAAFRHGASLGETCRAAYAYLEAHADDHRAANPSGQEVARRCTRRDP